MSDDEIEVVEKRTVQSISGIDDVCQLCPTSLHGLNDAERKNHYEEHMSGRKTGLPVSNRGRHKPASAIASPQHTTPMKFKKSEENVFWCPAWASPAPDNYSPDVLSVLKGALKKSYEKDVTKRALLCYERTPHIFRESFDTNWGCGYRNFLITCAALMDQQSQSIYSTHLSSPSLPGVRSLQHWIEEAWKQGYDDIGARYFDHQLIDTKKKLGTGDLYVAFTSRRIPCALVDINLKHSPKGFDALTEWVVNYFTEKREGDVNTVLRVAEPVMATRKMPVIMQYDGHSVTIVGYELGKNGKYNLLVFDPSSRVPDNIRRAARNASSDANLTPSSSISLGKSKRRKESKSPTSRKRSRANEDPNDGIVSISDSDDEKMDNARHAVARTSALDPDTIIKSFRFKQNKRKYEYQLLYFTMDDPLSDQEQNDRKVVLSVVEC